LIRKNTLVLVEKYDISHKIFNELANLESRHILFSIIKKPKRAQVISKELKIPISSTYKKIKSLIECSLILEAKNFTDNGIVSYYQSRIDNVEINISKFEPSILFSKNLNIKK